MAIFVVTTVNDSGAGSLRDAIAQSVANGTGADTIQFDSSIMGQTIRLTSGPLTIASGTVTIDADGNNDGNADLTISGDATGNGRSADDKRLFGIDSDASLTLDTVDLQGGYVKGSFARAGTIGNYGTLTIKDSRIRDMYARGADGVEGSFLTIDGGHAIAGIFNVGTAVISNTIFEDNTAIGGDGGDGEDDFIPTGGGYGGDAVANVLNLGTLTITGSFIRDGVADAGDGGMGGDSLADIGYGYAAGEGGYGNDGGNAVNGIFNRGTPGYTSYYHWLRAAHLCDPEWQRQFVWRHHTCGASGHGRCRQSGWGQWYWWCSILGLSQFNRHPRFH